MCYTLHMKTKIIKINKNLFNIEESHTNGVNLEEIGDIIKKGGVVAFPTETVYGLGANALDEKAAAKIYQAKGRPSDNPLIIHISEKKNLDHIAYNISIEARAIIEQFWPGPLTLVFDKSPIVPYGTTGGLETVAVRFPEHKLAQEIIKVGGGFVCAPSANLSGKPSPTLMDHVIEDMNGRIDMIVGCDDVSVGVESTILDMTVNPPMILRPGAITKSMLEEIINEVEIDPTITEGNETAKPKAPGMKYRHYAPQACLAVVEGEWSDVANYLCQAIGESKKIGIMCWDEHLEQYRALFLGKGYIVSGKSEVKPPNEKNHKTQQEGQVEIIIKNMGSKQEVEQVASKLYEVLREFDQINVEQIFSESFENGEISTALMNRLNKAAGYNIVRV